MKRYAAPLLVCVIGACALVIGRAVVEYRDNVATVPQPRVLSLVERQYQLEWNWRTEHEWIVSDVVAALVNIASFARTGRVPAPPSSRPENSRKSSGFRVSLASR